MALLFTEQYFHKFHEKVALHENIIVNSYVNAALLATVLYISYVANRLVKIKLRMFTKIIIHEILMP